MIGDRTAWSDYRRHLASLDSSVATYVGPRGGAQMPGEYAHADVLLVPSRYEPGSLVAGEALASGLVLVSSDEVGAAEVIAPDLCRVFPSGDLDAFEQRAREVVRELSRQPRRLQRPSPSGGLAPVQPAGRRR